MANGFRFPAPLSAGLGGVLAGATTGVGLAQSLAEEQRRRQRFELSLAEADRQRRADELRLGEAEVGAEATRRFPEDLARLMGGAEGGPATLTGLGQQVGPEGVARLLGTQRGRGALELRGIVTEEEFKRRKGLEGARSQFQADLEDSAAAAGRGDAVASELALAKAFRTIAPFLPEGQSMQALEKSGTHQREAARLVRDTDEHAKADRDRKRLAGATTGYMNDPSPAAFGDLISALTTPESDLGKKQSDDILSNLAKGVGSRIETAPLSRIHSKVAANLEGQRQRGERMDDRKAWLGALADDPVGAGAYLDRAVQGKAVPKAVSEFFFGAADVPKTEMELAVMLAKQDGIQPGDPKFNETVKGHFRDLKEAGRPDQTVRGLQATRSQLSRELNTLRIQKGKIDRYDSNWATLDADERRVAARIEGIDDYLRQTGTVPPPKEPPPRKLDPGTVRRQIDSRLDSQAKRQGFKDFKDVVARDKAKAQAILDAVNKQLTPEEEEAYRGGRR